MRVLQIEANAVFAGATEFALTAAGMTVYTTDSGEEGVSLAKLYDYDAILLDHQLPDMNGRDVLRALRGKGVKTPVTYVSSLDSVALHVQVLEAGADDYLAKPFEPAGRYVQLLAPRLAAVARRARGIPQADIRLGNMTVDTAQKRVLVEGVPVHLTGKEYALVEVLALRAGATLTKASLMEHLYGGMDEPELKIVDVFVCNIRKKLREAGADRLIDTVWGRGYRLLSADEVQAAA